MQGCAGDYRCSVLHAEAAFEYKLSQIIDNEITYTRLPQTQENIVVFSLLQLQTHITLHP